MAAALADQRTEARVWVNPVHGTGGAETRTHSDRMWPGTRSRRRNGKCGRQDGRQRGARERPRDLILACLQVSPVERRLLRCATAEGTA